jgi:GNAT superfamily N-acetyltransferase
VSFEIREFTGIADAIKANEALGLTHYDEIALNKDLMVYAPDIERYARLEALGVLVNLAVYDGDRVIGYSINIVTPHLHYKDLLCAHNDMIFLAPEHRQGSLGVKLIKATKAACAARGVQLMLWHAKENTPLAKLLPRMGCKVQDILFSEVL